MPDPAAAAALPGTARTPRISLVVPAWNEAERLPRLFDTIDAARRRWVDAGGQPDDLEIIVGDNASTDATAAVARGRGARVVPVGKRLIAAARNGGAAEARGDLLAFVDADSLLHPDVFLAVEAAMRDPRALGGASGVTMERWSPGIWLTYVMALPMVWLTGFDTGLVFWRRADFEAIGGYDEGLAIAEDVDILLRLRRLGRPRGQSLVRLRGVKTITSTRKWDRHGDWHYFTQMPRVGWHLLRHRGALPEFARRYWYDGR